MLIPLLLCGCIVDTHSGFDNIPPKAYTSITKPIVAAYLHIGTRKIDPYNLDLRGVDILNMAFTVINNNRIGLLYSNHADHFMMVRNLKQNNPNLRVLISVGGYGTSQQFHQMASSSENRAVFIDDAVRFLKYYGFDGIDVDWEFPGMEAATRNADRKNFTSLLSELRNALDSASRTDGKKYMLTIAAGAFDLNCPFGRLFFCNDLRLCGAVEQLYRSSHQPLRLNVQKIRLLGRPYCQHIHTQRHPP